MEREMHREKRMQDGRKKTFKEFRVSDLSSFHGTYREQPFVSSYPVNADHWALNELFAACIPRLRKTANRLTHSREDSEDILQEALLLGFRKIHQFKHRAKFSTWMHSILRNSARTMWRRRRCEPFRSLLEVVKSEDRPWFSAHEISVNNHDPEKEYRQRERNNAIYEALDGLPPMYREVVLLLKIDELKLADAAKKLGVPLGTVKARMHRARRMIEKHINRAKSSDERPPYVAIRPEPVTQPADYSAPSDSLEQTAAPRTRRKRSRRGLGMTTLPGGKTIRNDFAQYPP
ncbi:MAG: RNA polymerase sigma factor [Candidatus Acidiferrales bacterium]